MALEFPEFNVVDLTHTLSPGIPLYPGDKALKLARDKKAEKEGVIQHTLTIGEHVGTHVDAPRHFDAKGTAMHQVSASRLVLKGVLVDMRERALDNPEFRFRLDDFLAWEDEHGFIPPKSAVLLHTGWGLKWHDKQEYLGEDEMGTLHFPGYGAEVAQFLTEERSVRALGIDTLSVDVGRSCSFPVHRAALGRDVLLLENLANLHTLPPQGFMVCIGALKIEEGSGAPARILAMVAKQPLAPRPRSPNRPGQL